jgi:parallel beta-helix repeat protein
MKRKCVAVGIILLFIGTCIIPLATSKQIHGKHIITVDDEPGDADFTSIKEAVNASSPGDTIEVYSGTYLEQEICIVKENITLRGIAHELGEGNDSGKPIIKGNGVNGIIWINRSYVTVSNFIIEDSQEVISTCIWVRNYWPHQDELYNITISDCVIRSSIGTLTTTGIGIQAVYKNIRLINNEISNCSVGINLGRSLGSSKTTGNIITDCSTGIVLNYEQQNVSGNRIKRCARGISIAGTNNIIYGNDIDSCPIGIYRWGLSDYIEGGNIITKNNFKNYSWNEPWWERQVILYLCSGLVKDKKDSWISNYWYSWKGVGPRRIRGTLVLGIGFGEDAIAFPIPWFDHDWHPAQEPYDIG